MSETTTDPKPALPAQLSGGIKWQRPLKLPEVGKIKIGKKGEERKSASGGTYRIPTFTDHFTVTTTTKDRAGDFIPDAKIMEQIGANCKELDVVLLYDDIDLNYVEYLGVYNGRTLWCRGNGETAFRLKDDKTGEKTQMACPCPLASPAADGTKAKCGPHGVLSVLLPKASSSIGGVYTLRTASANSCRNLRASMMFIKSLTGGVLSRIPLKLKVTMETKQSASGAKTVPILSLVYEPSAGENAFQELYAQALQIATHRSQFAVSLNEMEQERRKALTFDIPEGDDDPAAEITAEFQPGNQNGAPAEPAAAENQQNEIDEAFEKLGLPADVKKMLDESIPNKAELLVNLKGRIADREKALATVSTAAPKKKTKAAPKKDASAKEGTIVESSPLL